MGRDFRSQLFSKEDFLKLRKSKIRDLCLKYCEDEMFLSLLEKGTLKELHEYTKIKSCGYLWSLVSKFGFVRKKEKIVINSPILWDEFTSYLFGYVLGDGWIVRDSFGIYSCDLDVISKINANLTNSTFKINVDSRTKRNGYILKLKSLEWVSLFRKYGVAERKSSSGAEILYPKSISVKDLARGLFDSDGSVYKTSSSITASVKGCGSYIRAIQDLVPIHSTFRQETLNSGLVVSSVNWNGRYALEFAEFIYQNSTIFMDRKFEKFRSFGYGF